LPAFDEDQVAPLGRHDRAHATAHQREAEIGEIMEKTAASIKAAA
jgi:hypothetical protein